VLVAWCMVHLQGPFRFHGCASSSHPSGLGSLGLDQGSYCGTQGGGRPPRAGWPARVAIGFLLALGIDDRPFVAAHWRAVAQKFSTVEAFGLDIARDHLPVGSTTCDGAAVRFNQFHHSKLNPSPRYREGIRVSRLYSLPVFSILGGRQWSRSFLGFRRAIEVVNVYITAKGRSTARVRSGGQF